MLARAGIAVLIILLGATAAGAGAKRETVAPVGGNGALLLGRSGSDSLFVLHQGSRRPEVVRGVSVAENHAAAWSPDGLRIAVRTEVGLAIIDVRTGRGTVIASAGADPDWSPDGSRVAYSRRGAVWIRTLGSRRARRFASGTDPTWSPDGQQIAYSGRSGIFVRALAGGTRRLLRDYSDPSCTISYHTPDWSPGLGAHIAFTAHYVCSNQVGEVSDSSEIGVIEASGSPSSQSSLAGGNEDGPWGPIWSPNGRVVAFADDSGLGPHIAVARGRGRASIRLRGLWEVLDWQPLCTLRGGPSSDRLHGSLKPERICGFRGDDRIDGGNGQDRLFGERATTASSRATTSSTSSAAGPAATPCSLTARISSASTASAWPGDEAVAPRPEMLALS